MIRRLLLAIVLCLPLLAAAQQSAEPILRVELDKDTAAPGETITMRITLLGPTWFPQPPEYPGFEIPNLIVRVPEGASYPTSERIGNATWSGIIREYSLQPMVPGSFRIPANRIGVTYADPDNSQPVTLELATGEITFTSQVPAGAEGLQPFIAARSLTLEQNLDGKTLDLQPGEAFKRTVTARISGAAALVLPRLVAPLESDFLSAYPDEPRLVETLQNDEPVGERVEQITYIATTGGKIDVPAIELRWWNLETRQIETSRTDGFEISAQRSLTDILRSLDWPLALAIMLVTGAALAVLLYQWPRLRAWQAQRRAAYLASEAWAFKRAVGALGERHFGRAINAVDIWSRRIARSCQTANEKATSILLPLSALLYRRERRHPTDQDWRKASESLHAARRSCRALAEKEKLRQILPPLNPASEPGQ